MTTFVLDHAIAFVLALVGGILGFMALASCLIHLGWSKALSSVKTLLACAAVLEGKSVDSLEALEGAMEVFAFVQLIDDEPGVEPGGQSRRRFQSTVSCWRWLHARWAWIVHVAGGNFLSVTLFLADLYSDIQVMQLFWQVDYPISAFLALVLLLLPSAIVWWRSVDFLRYTMPDDGLTCAMRSPLALVALPLLDIIMCVDALLFRLLECCLRVPPKHRYARFLKAYKATRIVTEVVAESLPQFVLQSVMFVYVLKFSANVSAYEEFAVTVPTSLVLSSVSLIKAWIEVSAEAHERNQTIPARMRTVWQMGAAVPSSAAAAREQGATCGEVRAAGYTCAEVRAAGYTLQEAKAAGYTLQEMKAGYDPRAVEAASYGTCAEAKAAGYNTKEVWEAGFSGVEAYHNGYDKRDAAGNYSDGLNDGSVWWKIDGKWEHDK